MVRTTWGSTSVEKADEKSAGIGITSCGAGIRLNGGTPYRAIPAIRPTPMTTIVDRSGMDRYRARR